MKHRLLAQLDRRLDKRGELVDVMRRVGTPTVSSIYVRVPAIVRTLNVEQLIAGITQLNFVVIISPTHLSKGQWPAGRVPAANSTLALPTDPRIPTISDWLVIRGATKSIQRVAPIFDAGTCIRIEVNVLG